MGLLGIPFEVVVPEVPEVPGNGETPGSFCRRVARDKAFACAAGRPDAIVIGADTVVVKDGRILGKPADEREAKRFLRLLQGTSHIVYTGYAIVKRGRCISRSVQTRVWFRAMTNKEISWYVATGEPMDKAGAYAAQGIGSIFIERVNGSYSNVIGLPIAQLYEDLVSMGLNIPTMTEED